MSRWLVLRLDAPMMSFGTVAVDNHNPTSVHPQRSLLTGLLANALGWHHGDSRELGRLQERLVWGARRDHGGEVMTDYATVDLGQEHLSQPGWTTWGVVEKRAGGNSMGTHIRHRDYLVDAVYTVVLQLESADESPTIDEVAAALLEPARPLFIGRKSCLPSARLLEGEVDAGDAAEALSAIPWTPRRRYDRRPATLPAWVPARGPDGPDASVRPVADRRDWANQIHTGRSWVRSTTVSPLEEDDDAR